MLSENDLRALAEFSGGNYLLTSLYFQAPKAASRARRDELIEMKALFRDARRNLNGRQLTPEQAQSLERDTETILDSMSSGTNGSGRDQAVFACSGANYMQTIPLPPGTTRPLNKVVVGDKFYLRPLVSLLDDYPRHCVVMLDRERALINEVNFGEVEDQSAIRDLAVPRVRVTDWGGYRERQIERHAAVEADRHYDRIAEILFDLFKRYRYDRLVVAGHREAFAKFVDHLHEDLRKRVAGHFAIDLHTATADEVRARALDMVREFDRDEKRKLVELVLNNAGPAGLGVVGLEKTLEALGKKEVQTLLIGESVSAPGRRCSNCGYLGTGDRAECPQCANKLTAVEDVVDDAARQAIMENSTVRFVNDSADPQGQFRAGGNIGAVLRYRSEARPPM